MFILSASPSAFSSASPSAFSSAIFTAASSPRVSFSTLSSSSPKLFAVSVRLTGKKRLARPCFFAMAELVKDKEASSSSAIESSGGVTVVASGSGSEKNEPSRSRAFLNARTEEGRQCLFGL